MISTIPSPSQGVWQVGPFPVRAYALCILAGIVVAIWLGDRRWRARGGREGDVLDVAAWAVPFGIVGGRLYHVITSWQPYFGPGGHPVQALYVWQGGLGIWGAVTLGGLGAWIAARRKGLLLPPLADALAPGIVIAQAIGRWGNWFNNELYGGPTKQPWGLQIHQWDTDAGHAVLGPDGKPIVLGTFHPTFLYESLWDLGVAGVLILLDRRYKIGHGRLFALYVLIYTIGRGWIEALRVDPANHVLGLRLNEWTSLLVGLGALVYIVVSLRLHPGRETVVLRESDPDPEPVITDAEATALTATHTKPAEAKPADASSVDPKPGDPKPADAKAVDAKPAEAGAGEPTAADSVPVRDAGSAGSVAVTAPVEDEESTSPAVDVAPAHETAGPSSGPTSPAPASTPRGRWWKSRTDAPGADAAAASASPTNGEPPVHDTSDGDAVESAESRPSR